MICLCGQLLIQKHAYEEVINSLLYVILLVNVFDQKGWCQPVGGFSVYSTSSLDIAADDNKPIIVISANLDSRALFHDLVIGSTKDISGLVTVLAIADALSRVSLF